jgi:hypothetical protein
LKYSEAPFSFEEGIFVLKKPFCGESWWCPVSVEGLCGMKVLLLGTREGEK